ncbi:hypothetical protein [Nocardia amamiensis]|uniref:hypothetical protein n=1 Tax=Nocardia amamiensis TaxID=404578 RepID=UPI000A5D529D|nr:hypothetical protein [Nocardia amamiensis]
MPEELAVVLIVAAAVAGMLLLLFCVLPWLIDLGGQLSELEHTDELPQRPGPHAAPRRPFPVDEAHWVTQEHIDCDARNQVMTRKTSQGTTTGSRVRVTLAKTDSRWWVEVVTPV